MRMRTLTFFLSRERQSRGDGFSQRQPHEKGAAFAPAPVALNPDGSAHRFDQFFANRQPQPIAAHRAVQVTFQPGEALENLVLIAFGDAHAPIADENLGDGDAGRGWRWFCCSHRFAPPRRRENTGAPLEQHRPPLDIIFERVGEEIEEYAIQGFLVADDNQFWRNLVVNAVVAALRHRAQGANGPLHHLIYLDGLRFQVILTEIGFYSSQQAIELFAKLVSRLAGALDKQGDFFRAHRAALWSQLAQQFQIALDAGERGA